MRSARLLSILLTLQVRGHATAQYLARELEVSERTIYRDVFALCAAGVPIYGRKGTGGGFRLVEGYRTDLTGLTSDEAQAILALGVPGPMNDLGFGSLLASAQIKLSASLPAEIRELAGRTAGRLHIDSTRWHQRREKVPFLGELQAAVWTDRVVRITHRTPSGPRTKRRVEPLALVLKGVVWYLVSGAHKQVVYRASRLVDVEVTDETFVRPAAFDLMSFWKAWSEEFEASRRSVAVAIRVDEGLFADLPFIFGDAVLAAMEDAKVEPDRQLRLTLHFDSHHAAAGSILRLGAAAEVIEPVEVRELLVSMALQIAERYRLSGTSKRGN